MHYGWIIVVVSLAVGVSGYGTYFSFTLFYTPLVTEFGWSRAGISGAMSVGLIAYGLFALPMGWCTDRFGPRSTVMLGGLLFGGGTMLGAWITELWQLYVLYGGISAAGMGAVWAPLVSTVSRWFEARRGLAVGITVLGSGSGVFFVAPLAEALIATLGWRDAYLWLGLLSGGLIVCLALLLTGDPRDKGMRPYGASGDGAPDPLPSAGEPESVPVGIGRIARTGLFWRLSLTFGLWWFAGAIVYVQIAPFLLEKGMDAGFAALAVTLFGAGNAIGKVAMGLLCDRIGGRRSYQLSILFAAAGMSVFALAGGAGGLLATVLILGFGIGGASTQITTISVALFGTTSIGALMGAVLAIVGIIGAGGPIASGLIYDLTGSYAAAYHLGAAVFLGSMLLAAGLKR